MLRLVILFLFVTVVMGAPRVSPTLLQLGNPSSQSMAWGQHSTVDVTETLLQTYVEQNGHLRLIDYIPTSYSCGLRKELCTGDAPPGYRLKSVNVTHTYQCINFPNLNTQPESLTSDNPAAQPNLINQPNSDNQPQSLESCQPSTSDLNLPATGMLHRMDLRYIITSNQDCKNMRADYFVTKVVLFVMGLLMFLCAVSLRSTELLVVPLIASGMWFYFDFTYEYQCVLVPYHVFV